MIRASVRSARGCALLFAATGLASCSSAQRPSEDPLTDPSVREQLLGMSTVPWERLEERGIEFASVGDFNRAEQYLSAAIQRGGPPERILPRLLRVCMASQRYRSAIEYGRAYLDEHRSAWALRFLVATLHMGLGEYSLARRHLELVLTYRETHAEAHYLLANILHDQIGDAASADQHFRRYLELAPDGTHAEDARAGLLTPMPPVATGGADADAGSPPADALASSPDAPGTSRDARADAGSRAP